MADSWAVKWRPQTFSSLTGNILIGNILKNAVKQHTEPPAIFLAGTRGSGKCEKISTLHITSDGIKYAKDIFPVGDWKSGDFIPYKINQANMNGELEESSHAYYNGVADCLCIESIHGYSVTVTPNHPLYVFNGVDFEWKQAKDISENDFLTIPQSIDIYGSYEKKPIGFKYEKNINDHSTKKRGLTIPDYMTEELAEFLGLITGDGSVSGEDRKTICYSIDVAVYPDLEEIYCSHMKNLFNASVSKILGSRYKTYSEDKLKKHKVYSFNCHSVEISEFLKFIGMPRVKSTEKEVPFSILQSGKTIQQAFLRGLFETDGWITPDKKPEIGYASASENLVRQVQLMLTNMGIMTYFRRRYNKKYDRDYYYLSIRDVTAREKFREIGFLTVNKNSRLDKMRNVLDVEPRICIANDTRLFQVVFANSQLPVFPKKNYKPFSKRWVYGNTTVEPRNFKGLSEKRITKILDIDNTIDVRLRELLQTVRDKYYLDRVKSVTVEKSVETVDFTMPKTHSFLANGIVSHNTTSARIYAKAMCCENPREDGEPCNECDACKDIAQGSYPDVIEVDAASENSVQGIRDLVKTLNYLPTRGDKKVIILDECLTGDTDVLMADFKYHKIHTIKDGDRVLSFNPDDQCLYPATVSNCFSKESEIICVRTDFGKVKGSPNHRMLVKDINDNILYKHLCEISLSDKLCLMDAYGSLKNGPIWEPVTFIETLQMETVYDFEVETYHNFIANGFVSHNCHALSQAATNALLKTLEEPPEFVRFVFCTTEPQKVLDTIRSRCLMFRFNDITTRDIESRLRYIADQEGVKIDDAALNAIARNSNGGMRDSIMLLEQAHLANVTGEMIKPSNILELVGSVSVRDIQTLFQALKSGDQVQLLTWLDQEKFAPIDILNSSISFLETVILIKQGVSPAEFVSKDLVAGVMSLASTISFHDVTVMFEEFRGIVYDLRNLNGVSSAALFKLRMLGVVDKLTYQPVQSVTGQPLQQAFNFLQMVKSEFNCERIPLPDKKIS